ncbi:MAG: 50S ribosomal protein L4 [Oligosphaeraceae bacterium]|nr:50S ribosomal protein L4 [Oligosphaeraceae bacterium]
MIKTLTVKNLQGLATDDKVDIPETWQELVKGEQAVKDSVVSFLARMRSGTASTQTRSEVSRTGAKPWRQKGTGRARSGTASSPLWVGGAVAFGPRPRTYNLRVNRKVERLALKRAFSERLKADDVVLLDSIELNSPKTKEVTGFLKNLQLGENVLILVDEYSENLCLAARNLPNVLVLRASSVNTYLMLLYKKIIITKAGLEALGRRLA